MKRVFVSILTLAMILSLVAGCHREEDPEPTPSAPPEETQVPTALVEDEVIAVVDGAEIMYSQLAEQMVTLEAMYSGLADQFTKEELQEKLRTGAENVLENLIIDQILDMKINEFGLTLTEAEEAEAEKAWEAAREKIRKSVRQTYPSLEGEDLETMTRAALESSGLEKETVVAGAERNLLVGKLRETVLADLPAPDESQIEEVYRRLLDEQTKNFAGQPTAFEAQALGGDPVVYVPEQYRVLQEIYLRFDDDVIQLLNEIRQYDTDDSTAYEDMLTAEYARLQDEKLPELRRRLSEGEKFTDLMEEIKPGSSAVCNYVCENTTRLSQEYYDAAMGISEPGQVSEEAIKLEYGFAVLCWVDTLEPGPRSLDQVKDAITQDLAEQANRDGWRNIQNQWREEADIEVYEDRLGY